MLNRLWKLVNDRFNYLTPTIKPNGYASSRDGQRRRLYDEPQTDDAHRKCSVLLGESAHLVTGVYCSGLRVGGWFARRSLSAAA